MSTIKPRTTSIVIYQGDDMATLAELRRAAENAQTFADRAESELEAAREVAAADLRAGDSIEDEIEARDKAAVEAKARQDEYDAFLDEAAERAVTVVLHAIGRKRFRDLMSEHAPRKVKVKDDPEVEGGEPVEREVDDPDDAGYGVNVETFPMALLTFIDQENPEVRTIVEPEFSSVKAVRDFLDNDLAEGDFPGMWAAAYYLNRMPSADPKASRYSAERRSSAAI